MTSIELKDVCLDYIIKTGSHSLKKTAIELFNNYVRGIDNPAGSVRNSSYRALKQINLQLREGDRVGILGRNGAGKSTLLRVLAKIYKPNQGHINICGKVSSLFDVDLGMNPEATGYENIVNLAVMRGISKRSALAMIPDVESFTELGDFLNSPTKTYSAGMQIKLAFGVATAYPPQIMLIDEIIGVGDMYFMEKATKRVESMIEKSQILVLTSHSNDIIKRFCNKVIVLNKGEIQYYGKVDAGIEYYQRSDA
jgi:ABC-type polysaccharide/polyol phosphate transport system ATPase subunit